MAASVSRIDLLVKILPYWPAGLTASAGLFVFALRVYLSCSHQG
jgi:hypothetical protein